MTSTILDKARGVAQQAVAGAQDALSAAQHKLDELSRASQLDDKLATLGAAFYAEQRSGGDRGDVDAALQEVDAHVLAYGWTRDTSPSHRARAGHRRRGRHGRGRRDRGGRAQATGAAGRSPRGPGPGSPDLLDEPAHDRGDAVVLGGEHRGHAAASRVAASASGMMPPTTTGTSVSPGGAQTVQDLRDEGQVRAGQDGQTDAVDVLRDRSSHDLRGRQPDALVDDLETGVARADRDLLGAVAVPVEPRLADQEAEPVAELVAGTRGPPRARR